MQLSCGLKFADNQVELCCSLHGVENVAPDTTTEKYPHKMALKGF